MWRKYRRNSWVYLGHSEKVWQWGKIVKILSVFSFKAENDFKQCQASATCHLSPGAEAQTLLSNEHGYHSHQENTTQSSPRWDNTSLIHRRKRTRSVLMAGTSSPQLAGPSWQHLQGNWPAYTPWRARAEGPSSLPEEDKYSTVVGLAECQMMYTWNLKQRKIFQHQVMIPVPAVRTLLLARKCSRPKAHSCTGEGRKAICMSTWDYLFQQRSLHQKKNILFPGTKQPGASWLQA